VITHAAAKALTVKLILQEKTVTLIVQDDGAGFDVRANSKDKHFGLLGMRERVQIINGEMTIKSQPGNGTTVRLTTMAEKQR
jgi:two-component system sensor histidine kinase DegS